MALTNQLSPEMLLKDPLLSFSLKGTRMTIMTKSPVLPSISGYFYCIDPETGTIALLTSNESCNMVTHVELIYSHAVTSIQVHKDNVLSNDQIDKFKDRVKPKVQKDLSPDEIELRKSKILNVLQSAQLPYEEQNSDEIMVASVAKIGPPYGLSDIKCANEIVLTRLKELISSVDG